LGFLQDIFVQFLLFSHNYTHNYGWDIILLTLLIRLVLLPITLGSMRGMKAMQVAQPRMKELQEKFKDDRERMNREMMALYKEVGFNPISGCLPMLLQIPIFIILFQVLRFPEINGYLFINTSFYGMDLTSAAITKLVPDFLGNIHTIMPGMIDIGATGIGFFANSYLYTPALVVVALMAVTTIIQQKMMTVDPQQKGMMWMMNLMIIYFAFMMPTGVLLYWGVSNVLQFIQQGLTKLPEKKGGSTKTGELKGKKQPDKTDTKYVKAETTAVKKEPARTKSEEIPQPAAKAEKAAKNPATPGAVVKKTYPAGKQGGKKRKR